MNNIHQADMVDPRYIKGDGRFYSFNVMDLYSHQVCVESQKTKEDDQVASSLLKCWKAMGIPDFLQFDNELSFRGSNFHPRSFGIVLRLCLHYGVQSVSFRSESLGETGRWSTLTTPITATSFAGNGSQIMRP
ncbi:MAG: hypothetical protein ABSC57_08210 [Syntrophales bacterium]